MILFNSGESDIPDKLSTYRFTTPNEFLLIFKGQSVDFHFVGFVDSLLAKN